MHLICTCFCRIEDIFFENAYCIPDVRSEVVVVFIVVFMVVVVFAIVDVVVARVVMGSVAPKKTDI